MRRDHAAAAVLAVGERGRDGELALAADPHAFDALVPALDHVARAEREVERVAARAARVELLPVGEPADVVDHDVLAGGGAGASADDQVFLYEAAGTEIGGNRHGAAFLVEGGALYALWRRSRLSVSPCTRIENSTTM